MEGKRCSACRSRLDFLCCGGSPRPPRPRPPIPSRRSTSTWDRLVAKRPLVLETLEAMSAYLLKPEVLALLAAERHPVYRDRLRWAVNELLRHRQ